MFIKYICENCFTEFYKPKWRKSKFCSQKCHYNYSKGKKHSKEWGKNISKSRIGIKFSKNHIKNLSLSHIGYKMPDFQKEKIRQACIKNKSFRWLPTLIGNKNYMWKGDKVGYDALHNWVTRKLGRSKKCKHCGVEGEYKKRFRKGKQIEIWSIEWANKSGLYLRIISDWLPLCHKCHSKYDNNYLQN